MKPISIENDHIRLTLQNAKEAGLYGRRRKRNNDRRLIFAISSKSDNAKTAIGTIALTETDFERREAAIGRPVITLIEAGPEIPEGDAVRLLCRLAFEVLRLEEIVHYVDKKDEASLRLFQTCGFTPTSSIVKQGGQSFYEMRLCSG
ncbi:GNAT family N-acetyltransferase [Paenibacillus sp. MBLB4367]|uniref:GNAT family N-acetyltransferase n=1 Tax=Paenibacillus sp. MBLB4367 TaxID=3384767 RepID=UPI0039081270